MPDEGLKVMMEMKGDISSIKGILSTMAGTNELAIKAFESSQSAHHRIKEIREDIDDVEKAIENLKKEQNWLPKLIATNVITAGIVGIISFAISKV